MFAVTYFKLVRWKNLLLITYSFLIIKFFLFKSLHLNTKLSVFQFTILLLAILLITASGYIINDIHDVKADLINKPKKVIVTKIISKETALRWYKITNTLGILAGVMLSIQLQKPTSAFIFLGTALLLYLYAKKLKGIALVGNLTVSFLIALCFLILPYFELPDLPNNQNYNVALTILIVLSLFAFSINLVREIVKDIEDINGDYALNIYTLPILIGRKRTKEIAAALCLFPLSLVIFMIVNFKETYKITSLYLLFSTLIPLLYIMFKLRTIKSKKKFHNISTILKIMMFLGINSVLIFSIFQQ